MKFRARLSLLSLETRENPSLMIAPPISQGAPAKSNPATAVVSAGSTNSGATTQGAGSISSSGSVNVTTTSGSSTTSGTNTGTSPTTGILATGNNLAGQPILESSLVGN